MASRLVKVMDRIICKEQSAFIAGRQILDGPFILNETMEWCKKRKEKLMIFKIDFEKAYDTVPWDFLNYMLNLLGFGCVWHSWVCMVLKSSRTSILVNGSPTDEFTVRRGLRQGDPLSPFLFLIVMEELHLCIKEKILEGVFHGVSLSNNSTMVYHFCMRMMRL
ncbi:secreted RxLR effector protein 78-like [Rutidosis leptorrhynchoides]|uniref:secreted RxLR effector protein 78-like n=1 Tax=Rutidosis leptorrhynchoides TaxID=125765 RepID=UPI003A9A1E60